MPLKTENLEDPILNLTPMIDVVFLLIIFFMVGARFTEEADDQKFDVQLPTAAPLQTLSREPDPLVVSVNRSGQLSLGGRRMSREELRSALEQARTAWSGQTVIIRGDGDGSYQSVIDVMSLCHQFQITRFSLAFQPEPGDDGKAEK
ncbi:MAG: ExbD/TolR family protein [Planctomyces sp.]